MLGTDVVHGSPVHVELEDVVGAEVVGGRGKRLVAVGSEFHAGSDVLEHSVSRLVPPSEREIQETVVVHGCTAGDGDGRLTLASSVASASPGGLVDVVERARGGEADG